LQRLAGNAATSLELGRVAPRAPSLQRAPEPATESVREEEEEEYTPQGIWLGGMDVTTYDDARELIGAKAGPLAEHKAFLDKPGKSLVPQETVTSLAEAWRLLARFKTKAGPVDEDDMLLLIEWHDGVDDADFAGRSATGEVLLGDLLRKRDEIRRAEAEFTRMEPALRRLQHLYFTSDQPNSLIAVGDAISEFLGTVESIKDTSLKVETALDNVHSWRANKTLSLKMAEITGKGGSLFEVAGKITSTYDKFKALAGVIDLLMPQRTRMQERMGAIKGMAMASDSVTSLPVTGYPLGPLADTAMVMMANIQKLQSEDHNHESLRMQDYDAVIWSLETGGRTLFRFVLKVMGATSADQVPELSDDVRASFLDNRDRFDAALGGRSPMPITGTFITGLHDEKFKRWAFEHRKDIWGALYGDVPPPE